MARPQLENGHVRIANDIAEALSRTVLNPTESRVLWAIFRKTYGWHKKRDRISFTQFEEMTGLNRRHISPIISRLITRNIITRTGNKYKLEYGLQKDYEHWLSLPKQVTIKANKDKIITQPSNDNDTIKSLPVSDSSLPKQVTKSLPKQVNTKETKAFIQKKVYSVLFIKLWKVYPLHKDKLNAEMLFEKLKPSEELVETMIQAIERQKAEREHSNGFIPEWKYLVRWLKGKNWTDEISKTQPTGRVYKDL